MCPDDTHTQVSRPLAVRYARPKYNIPNTKSDVRPAGYVHALANGGSLITQCCDGQPCGVASWTLSCAALMSFELFTNKQTKYGPQLYRLPKEIDEKVARMVVRQLGGEVTILDKPQAAYIGVKVTGPYKNQDYRY